MDFVVEPTRNVQVTVGVTSTIIAEKRNDLAKRKEYLIRNISGDGTRISISPGYLPAVVNTGIILEDGESYGETTAYGGEIFQGGIAAIGSAATGKLSIYER